MNPENPNGKHKNITPANTESEHFYIPAGHYNPSNEVRSRGFENGILRVAPNNYETFIEESELRDRLARYNRYLQKEQKLKEEEIKKVVGLKLQYQKDQIESEQQLKKLEELALKRHQDKHLLENQAEEIEHQKNKIQPSHSIIVMVMYLIAGLIFMGTDFGITHNIATNALDMSDDLFVDFLPVGEATIFALGLSFLAFALKPVVDRIFEQPYKKQKKIARMNLFLCIVGTLALINLAAMGLFRQQVRMFENNIERIDTKLEERRKEKALSIEKDESLEKELAMLELQLIEEESKIDSDIALKILFIFSSMLFAIAGAICFSIAFPLWQDHYKRNSLWRKSRQLQKQLDFLGQQIEEQIKQKYDLESLKKLAIIRLPELIDVLSLNQELEQLKEQEHEVLKLIHLHHTNAQKAWYRDNYERGLQYFPVGEDKEFSVAIENGNNAIDERALTRKRYRFLNEKKDKRQYLYEQIRDYLDQEVQKSSSNAEQNGTH